ncbi:hypothetical protein TRFO_35513 [Tritrichomonas foetus]|uniref:Uncharacterized protein n=1 Tax=Tritrichomonas foetus TaxID=1144522 RepID=A0A1J4JHA4_9EUKA|nr:hypothetical protein TRFO_35513 [Tritrichomonas foetus]|eukprot:OHS98097.1 hypothetical protein TRFO_35513 [Tritrichomonas foetus]
MFKLFFFLFIVHFFISHSFQSKITLNGNSNSNIKMIFALILLSSSLKSDDKNAIFENLLNSPMAAMLALQKNSKNPNHNYLTPLESKESRKLFNAYLWLSLINGNLDGTKLSSLDPMLLYMLSRSKQFQPPKPKKEPLKMPRHSNLLEQPLGKLFRQRRNVRRDY